MTCEPHWTAYLSALLAPTIAVLGAVIAYCQWRTAQNKLKLELFEKRFAVYDEARTLLSSILTNGKVREEAAHKFLAGTREAKWLLNTDVAEYLDKKIYNKAILLQALDSELDGLRVGPERSANVKAQSEIKKRMVEQYDVLDSKFSEFLYLKH